VKAVHLRQRDFQCSECTYRSARSSDLRIHVDSVHRGKKGLQCPHCDYTTAWGSCLKGHIEAIHKKTIR
jgi:RE1-silencing transcription factor